MDLGVCGIHSVVINGAEGEARNKAAGYIVTAELTLHEGHHNKPQATSAKLYNDNHEHDSPEEPSPDVPELFLALGSVNSQEDGHKDKEDTLEDEEDHEDKDNTVITEEVDYPLTGVFILPGSSYNFILFSIFPVESDQNIKAEERVNDKHS